jgi:serine/threonine protein kinase
MASGTIPIPEMWFSGRRYMLKNKLGDGASGTVYEAYDVVRKHQVALKILKDDRADAKKRFRREFRTLTQIKHPNLVKLYDVGETEGQLYFTMELIIGDDLMSYLRPDQAAREQLIDEVTAEQGEDPPTIPLPGKGAPNTPPDYERLHQCLLQLVDVVSAMHRAGIIHRDLKPGNILVDGRGRVVVLDLGIVASIATAEGTEITAGTPAYMAPEQLDGAAPTAAADWYAVGMILYVALTGERPFHGAMAAVRRIKHEIDLPRPSQRMKSVPESLDALCHALLSRHPADRPTAAQILGVLRRAR